MTSEQQRIDKGTWKIWGPYVSDRQWGTVREDYSANGAAWQYTTHDIARSYAFRWGEEGIAGICNEEQLLCFAPALWNKKDPILKERYFGLTNTEGNHGEDVKELYYYLDNTPTHSYMKMLYKYPQQEFPYTILVEENRRRTKQEPEFEILDTGIFNDDNYFDVFVEYAKEREQAILIKITVYNRGREAASLHVLPTLWFRNTWAWGYDDYRPQLRSVSPGNIAVYHQALGQFYLQGEGMPEALFCNNETNTERLYGDRGNTNFYKDGINDFLVFGSSTINPAQTGTKAAFDYHLTIPAGEPVVVRLSLSQDMKYDFTNFDETFQQRIKEADVFYANVFREEKDPDVRNIKRQALAGLLWNKQFYDYDVHQWLRGDPGQPPPPSQRLRARNAEWDHLHSKEILSVPDKWEFPWFASWDMAFHCYALAMVDTEFAKTQLLNLVNEWYMHPNGQLPAYEWSFSDCNPPIHAMATWEIYKAEKQANGGRGDVLFLEKIFHKLMLNFNWWVNRRDAKGDNIFEAGFLGLDNIGVIDRNAVLPGGGYLQQSDATGWMAMYALNLLHIAHELFRYNPAYAEMTSKYFEHFLYIAGAMNGVEGNLWDDEDNFYYDQLLLPGNKSVPLKVRSLVGLIPLFVVETVADSEMKQDELFERRRKLFAENRPDLANLVSHWDIVNKNGVHLFSLMRGFRMKMTLKRLLDENEFLSDYGIRSLSKFHQQYPYQFNEDGQAYTVSYTPGESDTNIFGGNSNWRGSVWMPMNWLVNESLRRYYTYYGDEFKVECPTGSGCYMTLNEVADELSRRVMSIFLRNKEGLRPVFGHVEKMQKDGLFNDYLLFHEYFHGDSGKGLGASHQTGWTALIACFFYNLTNYD
ncbi:MGH1-like glycoside hydrolase domain-containing protein [Flavisolibacter nicotianae]|uniref:MGH1-like glycoside hydrolase domain-containing protein n=1 Tax=Flavisolibacter nicotianae TaxID=2364882 RepID=UPI000EB33A25|nr:glucosidase [Flavisolibacter nicotianae]